MAAEISGEKTGQEIGQKNQGPDPAIALAEAFARQRMPEHVEPDPPEVHEVPPGFMTIDACIARVMDRLAMPEAPAVAAMLAALRGGMVTGWLRTLLPRQYGGDSVAKLKPSRWADATIDRDDFRAGQGGVGIRVDEPAGMEGFRRRFRSIHPHRVVIPEAEFEYWLTILATAPAVQSEPPSAPTVAPKPSPAAPGNPRGPRATKRAATQRAIIADYLGRADALAGEKEETLATRYAVSRDTARKARAAALSELRRETPTNPDISPTIDK